MSNIYIKIELKKNSIFNHEVKQKQETIKNFCHKISRGKAVQLSDDFMIFARIESLILGAGIDDALIRAEAYIKAGADGIMIDSKHKDPAEIIKFMKKFRISFLEKERERTNSCILTNLSLSSDISKLQLLFQMSRKRLALVLLFNSCCSVETNRSFTNPSSNFTCNLLTSVLNSCF